MKHSPLPWKVDEATDLPLAIIEDSADGYGIFEVGERTTRNIANSEYAVRACNAYPKLLEFVRRFAWEDTDSNPNGSDELGFIYEARALLARIDKESEG